MVHSYNFTQRSERLREKIIKCITTTITTTKTLKPEYLERDTLGRLSNIMMPFLPTLTFKVREIVVRTPVEFLRDLAG